MSISRCGAAVLTAGVGLICLAPLTAVADGIEVADADAPVVGMAYAPGSSDLWIVRRWKLYVANTIPWRKRVSGCWGSPGVRSRRTTPMR